MPALELWGMVQTQWRGGGWGIIGLDFPAVLQIARLHNIDMTKRLFAKIRAIENLELEAVNKE